MILPSLNQEAQFFYPLFARYLNDILSEIFIKIISLGLMLDIFIEL